MAHLPHILGQDFAYALGRVGSLESGLLDQADIDRLLGAPSGGESVKMLRDIGFVRMPEEPAPLQFILDATVLEIKETVENMTPERKHAVFHPLWISWDRPRIAYELKKKNGFALENAIPPYTPICTDFSPVLDRQFESPGEIDDAVANACNEKAVILAKMSRSYIIYTYIIRIIDIEHMQREYRSKNGEGRNARNAMEFEREMVATLRELLDDMRTMFLGPEPVFSYAARAMNHLAVLRVLLAGKVNNLEIQEIKSSLPPLL